MSNELARLRMRTDKQKVADLLGVDVSALYLLPPSRHPGMFAYHHTCNHGPEHQFWLKNGDVNPNRLREMPVYINVLFDEDGICYGTAGVCPCGRAYFAAPTIELLEFLDTEAAQHERHEVRTALPPHSA